VYLYAVLGCSTLVVVLLTYALVRESRLRRALAHLLMLFLKRERRSHVAEDRTAVDSNDHAGRRLR